MKGKLPYYDVIVVGSGHAGVEAALAASRLGSKALLLTQNLDTVAQMSCNPAIGGLAKGHIVREIDALGGAMGMNADATGLQFRLLESNQRPKRASSACSMRQKGISIPDEGGPRASGKLGHQAGHRSTDSGRQQTSCNGSGDGHWMSSSSRTPSSSRREPFCGHCFMSGLTRSRAAEWRTPVQG